MDADQTYVIETSYLEYVQEAIPLREEELDNLIDNPGGANPTAARAVVKRFRAVKDALPDPEEPYFVRIDFDTNETHYYGYGTLHLPEKIREIPHSHAGVSKYLVRHRDMDATGVTAYNLADLPNVVRRTRISVKNGELIEISPPEMLDSSRVIEVPQVIASELLKASMSETRQDSLSAVGSTLQPDQFRITRAPDDVVLSVQGPPGSGKTIVLLERLSRIAFKDPTARKNGILLIGPNQTFLDYVQSALAQLGKADTKTKTVENLTKWKFSKVQDHDSIQIVKASITFQKIVDALVNELPQILDKDYIFQVKDIKVTFTVSDSFELINAIKKESISYENMKERVTNTALIKLSEQFNAKKIEQGDQFTRGQINPEATIKQQNTFKSMIKVMFPDINPERILKTIKTSSNDFIRIASNILEAEDVENWLKYVISKPYEITQADIPILDYIQYKIQGKVDRVWGYIAVDEAQNLTPMQLNMLSRRLSRSGAVTLTGDLAQAIGPIYYENWSELSTLFESNKPAVTKELTRSYRVPKELIDYSKQFLENSEVDVKSAEPFLDIKNSLEFFEAEKNKQIEFLKESAQQHLDTGESVLILGSTKSLEGIKDWKPIEKSPAHIKIYEATEVKGLEFDVVFVVDPVGLLVQMNYEISRSARLLYVISTRATKRLYLIGSNKEELQNILGTYHQMKFGSDLPKSNRNHHHQLNDHPNSNSKQDTENMSDDTGIPSLCLKYNLEVSTSDSRYLEGTWTYKGMTQQRCVECESKPQLFFQGEDSMSSMYAMVCTRCLTIRGNDHYGAEVAFSILQELES